MSLELLRHRKQYSLDRSENTFFPNIEQLNSDRKKKEPKDTSSSFRKTNLQNILKPIYQDSQKKTNLDKKINKTYQPSVLQIPMIDNSKTSNRSIGCIYSYGANTHQGLIRNYNEDRLSIILNMVKPDNKKQEENWPRASFFGIYDGHGGSKCADLLRDQLHNYIVKDQDFPQNPRKAIIRSIYKIEKQMIDNDINKQQNLIDFSGSCLTICLIVDKKVYIANVGDSRAILSRKHGSQIVNITQDHKPNLEVEQHRIISNGGNIYQSLAQGASLIGKPRQIIYGPYRVMPGRLSVSRTIGDISAKLPKYGGNIKCVVCRPDIQEFDINEQDDFILIGCDGVFDELNNKEIVKNIYDQNIQVKDFHKFSGLIVDSIFRQVFQKQSMDNLSIILITFQNFEQHYQNVQFKGNTINLQNITEIQYQHQKDDEITDAMEKIITDSQQINIQKDYNDKQFTQKKKSNKLEKIKIKF